MADHVASLGRGYEMPLDVRQHSIQRRLITAHGSPQSVRRRRSIRVAGLAKARRQLSSTSYGRNGPSFDHAEAARGDAVLGLEAGELGEVPTSARDGTQSVSRAASVLPRSRSMYSNRQGTEAGTGEGVAAGRRSAMRIARQTPSYHAGPPTPRLVHDLVDYYVPREDLGKQGLMLDPELYTPNRLLARDACKFHPRVRAVLGRIWCVRGRPWEAMRRRPPAP